MNEKNLEQIAEVKLTEEEKENIYVSELAAEWRNEINDGVISDLELLTKFKLLTANQQWLMLNGDVGDMYSELTNSIFELQEITGDWDAYITATEEYLYDILGYSEFNDIIQAVEDLLVRELEIY